MGVRPEVGVLQLRRGPDASPRLVLNVASAPRVSKGFVSL